MENKNNNLPMVVIFGRTNVGKSTLFNCLTEKQKALTADIEGTTRDSNIGYVTWRGKKFKLIDTGGIIDIKYLIGKKIKASDIEIKVQQQARSFLKRADLILFLVDSKTGFLPPDKEMALLLKKILPQTDHVLLVANKVDNIKQQSRTAEFHKLALGEVFSISAITGSGTGDLLDIIVKKIFTLPDSCSTEEEISDKADVISVCIIGKPNVGKSCLLNAILGEERVIVSPVPHTTREPQDTTINYRGHSLKLIDTAGISKKGQQAPRKKIEKKTALEKFGITKSLKALTKADIALLVIDINEPLTHQETKIIQEIVKRKKSIIIIANKWDLIKEKDTKKFTEYIYTRLPFISWAPILFVSALTGSNVAKIMDTIVKINNERQTKLSDSELNKFLKKIIQYHKPAKARGIRHPYIYEIKQTYINPPEFTLMIRARDTLHLSYVQFIKNRLRQKYGFFGTPIEIKVARKKINK